MDPMVDEGYGPFSSTQDHAQADWRTLTDISLLNSARPLPGRGRGP